MSCASSRLNLNTCMDGLKNDLSLSLFYKISLNVQWSEENFRNVRYTCVTMQSFFSSGCFFNFKSSVHDRASLSDRAKLNSGT